MIRLLRHRATRASSTVAGYWWHARTRGVPLVLALFVISSALIAARPGALASMPFQLTDIRVEFAPFLVLLPWPLAGTLLGVATGRELERSTRRSLVWPGVALRLSLVACAGMLTLAACAGGRAQLEPLLRDTVWCAGITYLSAAALRGLAWLPLTAYGITCFLFGVDQRYHVHAWDILQAPSSVQLNGIAGAALVAGLAAGAATSTRGRRHGTVAATSNGARRS